MSKTSADTPLMRQYAQIKAKYPGAILLFRVGDFYETFGEDAITTSKILGIVLTKRGNGSATEIELAGFPYHSLDTYLPKLVRAGQRVAICDQLEDPKLTKTIVKRGVTELVTPGVTFNDKVLDTKQNNYLAVLHHEKGLFGLSFLDVSTGEFMVAEGKADYADKLLQSLKPAELLICKNFKKEFEEIFGNNFYTYVLDDWAFGHDFAQEKLTNHFGTVSLKGFGISHIPLGICAAGAAIYYLEETQNSQLKHILNIARLDEDDFVWLDKFTVRNLELLSASGEQGHSLLSVLDQCTTPMGSRLLRKWLIMPLKDLNKIKERHDIVAFFLENIGLAEELAKSFKKMGDFERALSKLASKRITPRELYQVYSALLALQTVKLVLAKIDLKALQHLADQINPCALLAEKIENELEAEPPVNLLKGGVIKNKVNQELDELRGLIFNGKEYLLNLQKKEALETGISSLKIGFNNVFGYYLEVTHAHKAKVPDAWIRKQTLTTAERYITPELKEYEDKILGAEEKMLVLEKQLFEHLLTAAGDYIPLLQKNAAIAATLDCLINFSFLAQKNKYCKPEINDSNTLSIKSLRHPVIERLMKPGESYVANDLFLNQSTQQIIILTGPNMSGKSAVLRQTALAVIMAQMGCFVAADAAEMGLTDKIFTRVGANDNLSSGESTFMVEMIETASILNNLSSRSLVILDEIGRGTSTFDGVSLAWSIAEFLFSHECKPKTLFATHYHELNELEEKNEGICNYHLSIKELDNRILFLRKLKRGGSEHSFGIHVARMAGIPKKVLARAQNILDKLETERAKLSGKETLKKMAPAYQLQMFSMDDPRLKEVIRTLDSIDLNTLTPIEALIKLNEVKQVVGS